VIAMVKCASCEYDPTQVKMGIKEEMEHTDDPKEAEKIAKDHLREDPKYYTHLLKMMELVKSGKW